MRTIVFLCLLPFVALAQESQPQSAPATQAASMPAPPTQEAQAPDAPKAEDSSFYANVNLRGWTILFAGAAGAELGVGLRLPTLKSEPKRAYATRYLGLEASAHRHKFGAISSDSITYSGLDLSVRLGSEGKKRRRVVGRALRLGGGAEKIDVSSLAGDVIPSAISVYGVLSGELYMVVAPPLQIGVGATLYAGTPTEEQTGFQTLNVFPILDLLKLSVVF